MKKTIYLFGLILSITFFFACNGDDGMGAEDCTSTPSYANDITPIVNNACALSGCHVAGFADGDYSSYAGLKANADSGSLRTQVVATKAMPLPNANGPATLTDAEIDLFDCWIEAGAPNN